MNLQPLVDLPLPSPEHGIFIAADGWMEQFANEVQTQYEMKPGDEDEVRAMPLAVVRCRRTGRTRTLIELAHKLKKRDINTIFVTFDDYSRLDWEEQAGPPLAALLLRIAFTAANLSKESFSTFRRDWDVSQRTILRWLGSSPCVLMIDDLDRLLDESKNSPEATKELFEFLEANFLSSSQSQSKRAFVFSCASSATTLLDPSKVKVKCLPTISSLEMIRSYRNSSSQDALYHGLFPSMMIVSSFSTRLLDKERLRTSVTWEMVKPLLRSFLTGFADGVHPIFLPCLDIVGVGAAAAEEEKKEKQQTEEVLRVKWVMSLMSSLIGELTTHVREHVGWNEGQLMMSFFDLTEGFRGKYGFEMRFAFIYLIRVLVGECSPSILFPELPPPPSPPQATTGSGSNGGSGWSCSYNRFLGSCDYGNIQDWETLRAVIKCPEGVTFPHMAYYAPRHAYFDQYHAFALFYDGEGNKFATYAFRLHVAGSVPKRGPVEEAEGITKSFVVRGECPWQVSKTMRGWVALGQADFEEFVGVLGKDWTPQRLGALAAELGE